MNFQVIIPLISCISTVALGIINFFSREQRFVKRLMTVGLFFVLAVQFSLLKILSAEDSEPAFLWGKIAVSSLTLMFPVWYTISLVYGRKSPDVLFRDYLRKVQIAFAAGILFLVLTWTINFFEVSYAFPRTLFLVKSSGKYFSIFFMIFTVAILLNLEQTLRSAKVVSEKRNKIPLYLMIALFLFAVYVFSRILMFSCVFNQLMLTALAILIFANVFFIYFSIKKNRLNLEVQIGREAVYSSAMIFIVGTYLLIIGIVGKIVQVAGGNFNLFLSFFAAFFLFCLLLATLVSRSLKERVKSFVDRNFYKNKYDYRDQWGKFSDSLSTVVKLDDVLEVIVQNINRVFLIDSTVIFLNDDAAHAFLLKMTTNQHISRQLKFDQRTPYIDWLYRWGKAVTIVQLKKNADSIGLAETERDNLSALQAAIIVPLIIQQKFIGKILLGEKSSGKDYVKEDLELLETIANQSSATILNAQMNEELMVSRELESFHKLSSFVLHDLRNSVSLLSMVVKNAQKNWDNRDFQTDMLNAISDASNRMQSVVSKISSLPHELALQKELVQMNDLIDHVLQEIKIINYKNIVLQKEFFQLPELLIDRELFGKVIENMIVNAVEAMPEGGSLRISTALNGKNVADLDKVGNHDTAEITFSDSGMGMSEDYIQHRLFKPFQTTKKKGLGIGLYQCKEIVLAHNGSIEVNSKENSGASFKITIPVTNGSESSI